MISFFSLPDEMIIETWDWIFSNKDMKALRSSCKRFKALGDKHGYLRHLDISMSADYMNLMMIWGNKNLKGLRSLQVSGLNSPGPWIPFPWPARTLFNNCRMGASMISPQKSPTTDLRITDSARGVLRIDWSKVPKLRVLELQVYDADLTNLEICQDLEHLCLYFMKGKTKLPGWIADLPNLITIKTNLVPETKMHFRSKKLQVCLAPKRKRIKRNGKLSGPCKCGWERCVAPYNNSSYEHFTSNSIIVPLRHLLCQGYTVNSPSFAASIC
jgi:hypothetical protein